MTKIVCHCFLVCVIQNGTANVTGPPGQKGEMGIQGITGAKGESGLNGTKGQVHHSFLLPTPSFCGIINICAMCIYVINRMYQAISCIVNIDFKKLFI